MGSIQFVSDSVIFPGQYQFALVVGTLKSHCLQYDNEAQFMVKQSHCISSVYSGLCFVLTITSINLNGASFLWPWYFCNGPGDYEHKAIQAPHSPAIVILRRQMSRFPYALKLVPSRLAGLVQSLPRQSAVLWHCAILFRGELAGHSSHGINSSHLCGLANRICKSCISHLKLFGDSLCSETCFSGRVQYFSQFLVGIGHIWGAIWGSFPVRYHFGSNLGIICAFPGPVSRRS